MNRKLKRISLNIILVCTFIFSIWILIKAYHSHESSTIAASLAVITALITTWSSQKVIWKQEDDLEPEIVIGFDLDSRSGFIQLTISNVGGSSAFDVNIEWQKPLINGKGSIITTPHIKTFLKGEIYRIIVAPSVRTFEDAKTLNEELIYDGHVIYKLNKHDKRYQKSDFQISLEPYRKKARPYSDEQNYYLKSIQIPEILKQINIALLGLTEAIKELKDERGD